MKISITFAELQMILDGLDCLQKSLDADMEELKDKQVEISERISSIESLGDYGREEENRLEILKTDADYISIKKAEVHKRAQACSTLAQALRSER